MLNETNVDTSTKSEDALMAFDQNDKDQAKDFIAHHGIKGQKWGHRRYQNSDGSLTAEGRKRYGVGSALDGVKKAGSAAGKAIAKAARKAVGRQTDAELDAELAKAAYKHDRQMKKDTIQALSGKRKRLDKMTDAEVDAYLDRLSKEKSVRNAERDLKRMNRSDFSNFMHDLKNKSYEGLAEGAKQGLKDYTSSRIKQVGGHHMDMQDRKWNEKHADDHLTEADKLARANAISKAKYDIAKYDSDRRKLLSGKDDDDNYDKASKKSQNRFNIVKNDLERRALEGDKDAMDRLREYTKAKSKPKNDNSDGKPNGNNSSSDSNTDKKKKTKKNSRSASEWVSNASRKALPPARS